MVEVKTFRSLYATAEPICEESMQMPGRIRGDRHPFEQPGALNGAV